MENGYIILAIIALLFVCMYGYAYTTVYLENLKEKKAEKTLLKIEEERRNIKINNQKLREIKLFNLNKRSEEIRQELRALEQKKLARTQMKRDLMKIDIVKSQSGEHQQQQAG